jgi:hypothetical protein
MLQDIPATSLYPGDEVFDNALLVPSPLLTTAAALAAFLVRTHGQPPRFNHRIDCKIVIVF